MGEPNSVIGSAFIQRDEMLTQEAAPKVAISKWHMYSD